MVVLSEHSPQLPDSASLRDLQRATEAARLAGFDVYHIPQELPEGVSADDALWHVPHHAGPQPMPAVWVGYIPLPGHYEAIFEAARKRNLCIVNSPSEFQRAEEFDKFYPFISDLTAESVCIPQGSVEDCEEAAMRLGYPVFVKGVVQSLKAKGVDACVAHDAAGLRMIVDRLLKNGRKSLGRVVLRKLMNLRHGRSGPGEFPLGREFRAFIYRQELLAMGYYWEGEDDLAQLSTEERHEVVQLALEAARRVAVPYVAVDLGQLESGEWKVIEMGDAQFSGLNQTPIHILWSELASRLNAGELAPS